MDIQADQHGLILPDEVHEDWIGTGIHLNQLNPTTRPWGYLVYGAPIEFEKWQMEGWTAITPWETCPEEEGRSVASWWKPDDVHRIHFEKSIPGTHWKLRLSHWSGSHTGDQSVNESYWGPNFETFSLHSSSGEVREFPDWISADHDTFKNRIVWTKGQQLWAMEVLGDDFGEPVMLFDVAGEKGWRTPAPY